MKKTECIELIGDILVRIDTQRGSLSPGTPRRKKLDEFRETINQKQIELADLVFSEANNEYVKATASLKAANAEVKKVIVDIEKVAETFAALTSLVESIDQLFMLATGIG